MDIDVDHWELEYQDDFDVLNDIEGVQTAVASSLADVLPQEDLQGLLSSASGGSSTTLAKKRKAEPEQHTRGTPSPSSPPIGGGDEGAGGVDSSSSSSPHPSPPGRKKPRTTGSSPLTRTTGSSPLTRFRYSATPPPPPPNSSRGLAHAITMTTPLGRRGTFSLLDAGKAAVCASATSHPHDPSDGGNPTSGGSASKSFSALLKSLEDAHFLVSPDVGEDEPLSPGGDAIGPGPSKHRRSTSMWVERYQPRRFTELLSSERINRSALSWVKEWDPCVFGKPAKPRPHHASYQRNNGHKRALGGKWSDSKGDGDEPAKVYDRPYHKILLLAGPPGVGKTTLAHVVARHAGYRVVELNASDDRAARTFLPKVLDAVESTSVFGAAPTLLVIDEVDGLGDKDSIAGLVRIAEARAGERSRTRSTRGMLPSGPLRRPIVAICNDPYASGMKAIRNVSRVLHVPAPMPSRLVSRLEHVCRMENFRAQRHVLSTLVDLTHTDIRSCLMTLQFLSCKSAQLREKDLQGGIVGQKDFMVNMFQVMRLLFAQSRTNAGETSGAAARRHVHSLGSAIRHHPDPSALMEACFTNYTSTPRHDPDLYKTACASDWMSWADHVDHEISSGPRARFGQTWHFDAPLRAVHHLCRGVHVGGAHRFQLPMVMWEAKKRKAGNRTMLRTFIDGLECGVCPTTARMKMVQVPEELVSPLMRIISPPSLDKSSTRHSSDEQLRPLQSLLKIHKSYGLRYSNTSSGVNLDPPLHILSHFDGLDQSYVALDDDRKRMVRRELQRNALITPTEPSVGSSTPSKRNDEPPKKKAKPKSGGIPSSWFLSKKKSKTKPRQSQTENAGDAKGEATMETRVVYRFQEGFTNAVRRNVRMAEFL